MTHKHPSLLEMEYGNYKPEDNGLASRKWIAVKYELMALLLEHLPATQQSHLRAKNSMLLPKFLACVAFLEAQI